MGRPVSTLAPFMLAPDAKALADTGAVPPVPANAPPGTYGAAGGDGGDEPAVVVRAGDGAGVSMTAGAAAATTTSERWERHKVTRHSG